MSSPNPPDTPMPDPVQPALAYLTSQYPMLSMTFILREVVALRGLGLRIGVASINRPDRPAEKLTAEETREAAGAYHVKANALPGAVLAAAAALFTNPAGCCRGFTLVFRLAGLDPKRLFYHSMYFLEALMVGAWMRRERFRHLHVHLGSQAATVGLYVQRVFGVGFSITVHGPDEFDDARGQHLAEKIAAADFICCISFFCRSQLMKFSAYPEWAKLLVSRLGVDPSQFAPGPRRPQPEVFIILSVGRLVPAKGQHQLIDAVERLSRQGRRLRLHLVGAGPDQAALCERVARLANPGLVVFEGAVNHDRIRALYQGADLFCLSSFAEGIPVVLMEAMAMEIPCVSTQIAGIPELIRPGVDGLLVAPSDLDGLVGALAALMDDPALRQRLARSARARILEHYDLQRNCESLAATFAYRIKA